MYFRLSTHRMTILMGKAAMKSKRFAMMLKRMKPMELYILRKTVLARIGGKAAK